MSINIQHDKAGKKFIVVIDGKVSTLAYKVLPGEKILDYYSTFVPPELRGRHIGDDLVKYALDYAKENHYKIIPSCPFVEKIIDRNPKYKIVLANK